MREPFRALIEHAKASREFSPEYIDDISKPRDFPHFVRALPRADYSADGALALRGYVLRGSDMQVVFNENDEEIVFQPHSHAQSFGVVLQGECELVIDGVSTTYRAGDVYHVPGGVVHYARQSANYKDIVVFEEAERVPLMKESAPASRG
jgi:quercetin dioxygenase-like cupin family protein